MIYAYPVIIKPQKDGYYIAEAPDLPCIVVGGSTLAELMQEASDACAAWLADAEDNGTDIPVPTPMPNVETQPGQYASIVVANTSSYRLLNSKRAVKKAVSLPESLAFAADRAGLSLSKVLQDALRDRLRMR